MSKECFYSSSVGRKVFMALTGAFLVIFMLLHMSLNLFVLGGEDAYNAMTHFMALPVIKYVLQPVLALGFILHIIYGLYLTLKNSASRPVGYKNSQLRCGLFVGIALHVAHGYRDPAGYRRTHVAVLG